MNPANTPTSLDDDILDLAVLWAPLGGPTPERIRCAFGIDVSEYRHRLSRAVHHHYSQLADRTRSNLDRVYGPSILESLANYAHSQTNSAAQP